MEWMAEHRWQSAMWIRCFACRRFSSSRKNCIGVSLGGTSRMTVPRNSTALRADMVIDPAESTKWLKIVGIGRYIFVSLLEARRNPRFLVVSVSIRPLSN
uniref:Uncharacterized protein n=1 Tax=Solanum lycopersicum TaxID=4081 RepID=A0A3Q7JLE6_SOLLC